MAKYKRIQGGEKNDLSGTPFTKPELEKVCELYIEINGKGIHENNPKIHKVANELNRTIRSVENQLLGFRGYVTSKSGRANYNSLIPEVWREKNAELKKSSKAKIATENKTQKREFDEFKFRISSQLKTILGKNLITDDYVAVFELVKNSFDAHAKKVKIIFEDDKITIWDDGKGMNRSDIINKWLFVAYSAKNEGIEDIEFVDEKNDSYRDRINPNRAYAGAKGIGRFSSDRLGSKLNLTTRKINDEKYWHLTFDWDQYEVDAEDEFIDIEIEHEELSSTIFEGFDHGLILEISNLRSVWPRNAILDLKRSLEKLINPFSLSNEFDIEIISKGEIKKDNQLRQSDTYNERDIVNGSVRNFIFEALNISTTQIKVSIDESEEYIETELIDRGNLIYKIKEPNDYKYIPAVSNIQLFYLNQGAKSSFTRLMGIQPANFGSIFLFNNGFRVLPFGEPNNDPFNINKRKAQGYSRFLGTRELIGQVSISKTSEQFQETSSRNGGLITTPGTKELEDFFLQTLKKLESYVQPILWTIKNRAANSFEELDLTAKNKIIDFVAQISGKDDIQLLDYSQNLLDYINEQIDENSISLFSKLKQIAEKANDTESLNNIELSEKKYAEEVKKRKEAEKKRIEAEIKAEEEERKRIEAEQRALEEERKRKEAEATLEEKTTENYFLRSLQSLDRDTVLSFMHSIGISANMIDNYLGGIYQKLSRGMQLNEEKLKSAIEAITLEGKKIASITKYATKANFKVYAEEVTTDIISFITEYVVNILIPLRGEEIKVDIINNFNLEYKMTFKPIEVNLLIDNLISNSIRAGATTFTISYIKANDNIMISILDDGKGISDNDVNRVFDFGYTTTSGSGLGLFHVKTIIEDMNAKLHINNKLQQGVEFIITLT